MTETLVKKELTRRTFLKTTAAVAGTAAIAGSIGCTSVDTEGGTTPVEGEQVFSNWCRGNCGANGRCCVETKVREGKIVSTRQRSVKGKDFNVQPGCVKAPANPQRVYGSHRLLYPMLQKGERGSDNWERISWDEALALTAEKMQAAFDEYGPESVGFMSSYSGISGALSTVYYGFTNFAESRGPVGVGPERFIRKTGLTLYSPTGDLAQLHMNWIQLATPYNSIEDIVNAKNVFLLGDNSCDSGRSSWSSIMDAKEKGAKIIVVDPRFSNSAAHADLWVPIRPGTDGALLLAISNYIIDNNLVDNDYLSNESVAPLLIKEDGSYLRLSDLNMDPYKSVNDDGEEVEIDSEVVYDSASETYGSSFEIKNPVVTGSFEVEGIKVRTVFDLVRETIAPFTVEFAADECGLSVEMIEELARIYVDGPSLFVQGFGWQHYRNSWRACYAFPLMMSLTGNAHKPGAGITTSTVIYAPLFKSAVKNTETVYNVEDQKENLMVSYNRIPEIVESGKWLGKDLAIRVLMISACNPIECGIGYDAQIEAFNKIDFVVVASEFMNDTALQASLALPVTMTFEAEDYAHFMNQKAIEPVGESKSDFEIFVELAKAMGYDDLYDKDAEGYLREILDTEENIAAGVGYDDLHEQGAIYLDEIVTVQGVGAESNSTGRTQFFLENLITNGNFDEEITLSDKLPFYENAFEAYQSNSLREKYPLFGNSYHDNYVGHSMHTNVPWLNELRGYEGEPYSVISEQAAAERGIETGDMIRVFNDRGSIVTRAVVSKGIQVETVTIPRAYTLSEMKEGHLQSLTSIEARDRITNNDSHNDWLCQVEKVEV